MGSKEKLVERFKKLPKDFTFEETLALLRIFGYEKHNKGATSGSRIRFNNEETGQFIRYTSPSSRKYYEALDDEGDLSAFIRSGIIKIAVMDYLEYKGYKGTVEYSKEDNCLFGKVIGMSQDVILYEGQTLDELRSDFEAGIDDYIAGCIAEGVEPRKPFSGRLNLRMPSELHARVASLANSTGTTINDFINKAIIHELDHHCATS